MMLLLNIIYVCVLLLVGPSFDKYVDCTLVITPENVAALSGKTVTLRCASDKRAKYSIAWDTTNPGSTSRTTIYSMVLTASVSSYINVIDSDDGNCSLTIAASKAAGKRYICFEASDPEVIASAELTVLEENIECNVQSSDKSVNVNCPITSTGNWAPFVECTQFDKHKQYNWVQLDLHRNPSKRAANNALLTSWNYISKTVLYDITCSVIFKKTDKPKGIEAPNIPKGNFTTWAYRGVPPNSNPIWIAFICKVVFFLFLIVLIIILCRYKRQDYVFVISSKWPTVAAIGLLGAIVLVFVVITLIFLGVKLHIFLNKALSDALPTLPTEILVAAIVANILLFIFILIIFIVLQEGYLERTVFEAACSKRMFQRMLRLILKSLHENDSKIKIESENLYMSSKSIQDDVAPRPGDHIRYPPKEPQGFSTHFIVTKVLNDKTVEGFEFSTPPTENRETAEKSPKMKEMKSLDISSDDTMASASESNLITYSALVCKCDKDIGKLFREESLYRADIGLIHSSQTSNNFL